MIQFLKQPYPTHSFEKSWKSPIIVSIFVFAFLSIFQPFGIKSMPDSFPKYAILLGYGFVTFIGMVSVFFIPTYFFKDYFKEENWNVGKQIFVSSLNILIIGTANFLYSWFVLGFDLNLKSLIYFQLITLSIGFFPMAVMTLIKFNSLKKENSASASEITEGLKFYHQPENELPKDAWIKVMAENKIDVFSINCHDFLFAEAADNYIQVNYVEGNILKRYLIRTTLSKLEEAVAKFPRLVRCHRAYVVNLDQVTSFTGNAQGLILEIKNCDVSIPVSRKMVNDIKAILKK